MRSTDSGVVPLTPAGVEALLDARTRSMWHAVSDGILDRAQRELGAERVIPVTLQLSLSGLPTFTLPPHVVHFGYQVKLWTIGCAGSGAVEVDVLYASYDRYDGTIASMLSLPGDAANRPTSAGGSKGQNTTEAWAMRDIPANGFLAFNVLSAAVPFTIAIKLERAT